MNASILRAYLALCLCGQLANAATTVYDLEHEFSVVGNPNETWTNGAMTNLGSQLIIFGTGGIVGRNFDWAPPDGLPKIRKNVSNQTDTSDGGAGVYPPGSILLFGGDDRFSARYGVARFTVPTDGAGSYHLETVVHSYLDGPVSGDADFHVLHNGVEVFGEFLPGDSGTGFTNDLALGAGDTIDFVSGPGADGNVTASGLKIKARLTTSCTPVTVFVTNTIVVTETILVTNTVSLANLRAAVDSSGLPSRKTLPLRMNLNQAERQLRQLSDKAARRIGPVNAELADEIQTLILKFIGTAGE